MKEIIPIDPAQNIYANNAGLKLVAKQDVLFEGRTIQKLIYRDPHSLIWKIGQVALAALLTLATLGTALCFQKHRLLWNEALGHFKDRIVYQNVVVQSTYHSAPAPSITPVPVSIVQVIVLPPSAPPATPTAQVSQTDLALQLKKEGILKENPEYCKAVLAWEKASVSLADQVARLGELKQYAFGTDKWAKYFRDIPSADQIARLERLNQYDKWAKFFWDIMGAVPPLPEDIYQICNSNDHSKPGAKVKDTHVLVLVPQAVMLKGQRIDITLKNLGELVKDPKGGGHISGYNSFYAGKHENTPVAKSHWALMKKEVIPNSRNQTFARQVEMVDEYSQQARVLYSVPNAIDVSVCCFMHFVSSGTRLFECTNTEMIFTRCQELVGKHPIIVGVGGGETIEIGGKGVLLPRGFIVDRRSTSTVDNRYGMGVQRTF